MIKKNRWLQSTIIAFGALGIIGAAAATPHNDGKRQSMSEVPFTGPLAAPNPTALPVSAWYFEPYLIDSISYGSFNDNWNESNNSNTNQYFRSVTLIEYGVTKRLTAALLPTFGYNHISGGSDSNGLRLGDMTLRAHYMFHKFHKGSKIPTTSFAVSENIPTGQYDGLSNSANGLGSGVWSTKVGLWTQDYFWMPNGHILRTRFAIDYEFPDENNVSLNGRSVYGTGRGFSGHYNPGNTLTLDAAAEYALTDHWVPAMDVVYSHTSHGTLAGTQPHFTSSGIVNTASSVDAQSGPSDSLQVDPAMEYLFNSRYGVIAGASVKVAGRNTNAAVTPQIAFSMFY